MFRPAERFIAGRYLKPRRSEGFLTIIAFFSLIGIALGVGTLIVVLSVMNGFRAELLGRIVGLNGHVIVQSGPQGIGGYEALSQRLANIDGVTAVYPVAQGQAMASANGVAGGVLIRGVQLDDLRARAVIADGIVAGSLDALTDPATVMIGHQLARQMALRVGDRLTLISPKGKATAFGTVPRMQAFTVGAVFDVGMFEYDSGYLFMPLAQAQTYLQLPEAVNLIEVMTVDAERAPQFRPPVAQTVPAQLFVSDWQQNNRQFFNALRVERNVMFIILTLIILVAAFNIISGLIILVRSKQRDVAILRTMGASRGMILRVFFLTGSAIGVTGTLLGTTLGLAFALNIERIRQALEGLLGTNLFAEEVYFLSQLPARVLPLDVALITGLALALSLLATLYPSWRAARLDPVEALRHG